MTRVVVRPAEKGIKVTRLSGPARLALGQRLDINQASARDLALLPGVGPATARRIVMERRRHGPFVSPEDLTRTPGVGSKTLEILRPYIETG